MPNIGETKFQPREFPRSGSKAMRRRAKDSDYSGQFINA